MAARDILTLDKSMAPRLIRCLYAVALILIAVVVVLGLARGLRVITSPAPPPPAVAAQNAPNAAQPNAAQPAPPGPDMMNPAQRQAMMRMMNRRFGPRPRPLGPLGFGLTPRNPVLAGLWIMFGTLLCGAIMFLVVRILAEMGLAILTMPRRSET